MLARCGDVAQSDALRPISVPPLPMALSDPTRVRTTINLDREVYDTFVRMAEASGMSVGRCIGEWLADTADGAQFVALKMQEARAAPMLVMREMQAMSQGLVDQVQADLERVRRQSKAAPPGAARARPGGAAAASPSGNTGWTGTKQRGGTGPKRVSKP